MSKTWRVSVEKKAELIARAREFAGRESSERDALEAKLMPSPMGRLFKDPKYIECFESPLACRLALAAKLGARSRLRAALLEGANPDVGEPVDDVARMSPLAMSARRADAEACLELILAGACPNGASYQIPPLRALLDPHDGMRLEQRLFLTELLLAAGADPDGGALRETCGRRSALGIPLFGLYPREGLGVAMARMLVEAGADVDQRGCAERARGSTPLMREAMAGNEDLFHLLLSLGADPRAVDDLGRDATMWAASTNRPGMVDLCLAARGDGGDGILESYPSWRDDQLARFGQYDAWVGPFEMAMMRAKERRDVAASAGPEGAAPAGPGLRL